MVDTEDTEDCPITEEEEPTPTPEAEEQAAPDEEPTDEESQSAVEICDNTLDDDGDGLVDTEDTEDCPITEEEEPTPTPEAEEQAAPEEEPTPEAEDQAAPEEEPTPTPEAED